MKHTIVKIRPPFRGSGRRAGTTFIVALVSALLSVQVADGATTRKLVAAFPQPASPPKASENAAAVAVDESTGNVFLGLDERSVGDQRDIVRIFGSNGEPAAGLANDELEGAFQFNGCTASEPVGCTPILAFDNSPTSPDHGTLYVAGREVISRFTLNVASKEYEQVGTLPLLGLEPRGLAIAANGDLYVSTPLVGNQSEPPLGRISELTPTGETVATIVVPESLGLPGSLAVDSQGDLYVATFTEEAGELRTPKQLLKYGAGLGEGIAAETIPTVFSDEPVSAIAVSPVSGSVLGVVGTREPSYGVEYASSGKREGSFAKAVMTQPRLIAINGATDEIFIPGTEHGASKDVVYKFGPAVELPEAVTGQAGEVTVESATLNGTVDPKGFEVEECFFEYGQTSAYNHTVPCAETGTEIGHGQGSVPVHAGISGLHPGQPYHFRLVVTSAPSEAETGIRSEGEDEIFSALGPHVAGTSATQIGEETAHLQGEVDPNGEATRYFFEYVSEAQYVSEKWTDASVVPAESAEIGSGKALLAVAQQLSGLSPLTTYRYRLAAENAGARTVGELSEAGEEVPHVFTTYPSVPGSGSCSNDAVRSSASMALPDCRAYEQASPVYKDGNSVHGEPGSVQAAASGEGITFYADGGLPGGEGAQDFPSYLALREMGGSGWSTQGLLPPADAGVGGKVRGWDEELTTVYMSNEGNDGASQFFGRETGETQLVPIFSGEPKAGGKLIYAASVEGGNIVLFEDMPESLTDNAVYVWDKASGQVRLVSVLNEGSLSSGGFAGPYDWFGVNGTADGGTHSRYYVQAENALSADGSVAFFTAAGSGTLYERLNPTQPQSAMEEGRCVEPAMACTVELSATHKANSEGPAGSDPNGPKPAAFIGAASDGSSSFLLSSEELTNDATTGSFGIGRSDVEGGNSEAGFLPSFASALAVDAGHIYWANPATGSIGRANLQGGEVEPRFITGAQNPQGLALDGTYLYWANAKAGKEGEGTIGRAKLDGTEADQSFITGATNPRGIAVNASFVFWANDGTSAATHKIGRAKLNGSGPNNAYLTVSGQSGARGLAIEGTTIYWANPDEGTIGSANVNGSEVNQALVSSGGQPVGVSADTEHLYWSDAKTDSIGRAALDGSAVESSFHPGVADPSGIAVDAAHLYWAYDGGDHGADLYRYAGGSLSDLTPDAADPNGAEVKGVLGIGGEGSYVYFVANAALPSSGASEGGQCAGSGEEVVGMCNLYLWHEGTIKFITRLDATGKETGDMFDWAPTAKLFANTTTESTARVSPDGRTLLFTSISRLAGYENAGFGELYRSVDGGAPSCVSCNPTDAAPTGNAAVQALEQQVGPHISANFFTRNLSANGRRVFFDSPDRLVAADENGVNDVYEWEADGEGSCTSETQDGGCLYLISTGTSPEPSYFADAGADGRDVFFFTSQPLVAQDQDELVDVYDARELGGVAAQNTVTPTPCGGESCAGQQQAPPSVPSPGSTALSGTGNLAPPTTTVTTVKVKAPTRRQLLTKALKSCHKDKSKRKRQSCEKRARKRYGPGPKPHPKTTAKSHKRGK